MRAIDIKAIARRLPEDAINRGNLEVLDELVARDFVDHSAPPGTTAGRQGMREAIAMLRSAFPDLRLTLEDEMAIGDKVIHRVTVRGTMRGEFMGMPPTGRSATWTEIHIGRFAGSRLVEHWAVLDRYEMFQQLGLLPALQPSA